MRFAGSAPITDFLSKGIDTGAIAQQSQGIRSDLKNTGTGIEADLGATALGAQARVIGEGLIAEGQAAQAQGQAQGQMYSSLGSAFGSAISGFGGLGGGTVNSYDDIPSEGLRGSAAGGGPNAYIGTGGKYGTFKRF